MKVRDKVIANDDRVGIVIEVLKDKALIMHKDYSVAFVKFENIEVIPNER